MILGPLGFAFLCGTGVGCEKQSCEASIDPYANLDLTCAPTNLTSVDVSAPCAAADAGTNPNQYVTGTLIAITSQVPGTCHVALTFATGFTYATDVVFVEQNDTCGGSFVGPTQMSFDINNPPSTCVDTDAGAGGG